MKKFAGTKTMEVIRQQCEAVGIDFDQTQFDKGDDHVLIEGGGARVLYNTFNGRFFGRTPQGVEFNSDSVAHEEEPWFQALLSFFYVEKTAAV